MGEAEALCSHVATARDVGRPLCEFELAGRRYAVCAWCARSLRFQLEAWLAAVAYQLVPGREQEPHHLLFPLAARTAERYADAGEPVAQGR